MDLTAMGNPAISGWVYVVVQSHYEKSEYAITADISTRGKP